MNILSKKKILSISFFVALFMGIVYGLLLFFYPQTLPRLVESTVWNAVLGIGSTFLLFFISSILFIIYKEVYSRVFVGLVAGVLFGLLFGSTYTMYVAPVGDIFLRLIQLLVIPLVFASLCLGIVNLGDVKKIGRIGGKTIVYYMGTTLLAITIGVVVANVIKPGTYMSKETKEEYISKYQQEVETKTTQTQESQLAMTIGTALIEEQNLSEEEKKVFLEKYSKRIEEECQVSMEDSFSISQTLVNIVPKNPFQPLVNDDMLQVIFLSIMFGLLLAHIQQDKREILEKGIEGLNDTMMIFVTWVMKLAPWGVFALMAKIVSQVGFSILQSLFVYMLVVLSGLVLHMVIVYGSVLWLVARISIITFLKKIKSVILISFSTSSSCATIPVSMNCVEKEFNVTPTISSFVIPLGATINMDGTGLYQGVATIFIAQVYNIPLDIWGQLTIILTATLASIGTAGVPGVGIIILTMVLKSVNVPIEGIALIIGVDRVLDMCRTVLNVMGDLCASVVVQNSEWKREKK